MISLTPLEIIRHSAEQQELCLSLYVNSLDELPELLLQAKNLARKSYDEADASVLISKIERFSYVLARMDKHRPLGFFLSRNLSAYTLLPFGVRNLVVLSRSFHIKPLLKWQQRDRPFVLLMRQATKVQLFLGTAIEMKLLSEELIQQFGQTGESSRAIINKLLPDLDQAPWPIIVSGDLSFVKTVRSRLTEHQLIIDDRRRLVPRQSVAVRHQMCLELLEPYFFQRESRLIRDYKIAKLARRTSCDLAVIIRYAILGQVEQLFINERIYLWGKIDLASGRFFYHQHQLDTMDDDVLDDLAEIVLNNRGSVTVLPSERMPDSFAAAAILKVPPGRRSDLTAQITRDHIYPARLALA